MYDMYDIIFRFLQAGGSPERVVELLSDNYHGVAQTVNLLAEWMIQVGVDINEVQEMVESHLKEVIVRTFDPKKADSIFSDEGEVILITSLKINRSVLKINTFVLLT